MRRRYVVANWKLNLPPEGIDRYTENLKNAEEREARIGVAPPYPYLGEMARRLERLWIGAQNCAERSGGAFTGEVSAGMVRDCGARFVLIGHSERRTLFGETDASVAKKLSLAIEYGLTPLLCIGEDLRVRESGHVGAFLAAQIRAVSSPALERPVDLVIAYEPVWAIGTGHNATPAIVGEAIAEIRESLARFWPEKYAQSTSILYGGSVTPENVDELMADGTVDGFLVGGASLDSAKFLAIHAAARALPAA